MTLAWVRRTDRNLKCQICGEGMAECSDVRWLRSLSARGHHHQQQQPATWPAQSSSFAASTPTLVLATLRTGSNGGQSLCYRCWVWDLVKLTPHFFTFLPATVRWFVPTYLVLAAMGQAHHRKFPFQHSPPLCFPRWHDRERIVMARHFLSRVLDDTVVQRLGSTSSLPTTTAGVAILKLLTNIHSRGVRMITILANAFFRVTLSPTVLLLIPEYELRAQRNFSLDQSSVTPLSSSAAQEMRVRCGIGRHVSGHVSTSLVTGTYFYEKAWEVL